MSDNNDLKAPKHDVPMRDGVEEITIHISANRPGQLREDPRLDNYPEHDRDTPWNENHPVTMDESVLGAERNTNARFLELLAEEANGAVETDLPEGEPLVITLIGPIRTWWGRLESPEYAEYNTWRKAIQSAVVHAGHLVYSPHLAWKGAWHEKAQRANDMAIMQSDVVIVMTPPDTVAVGTAAEIKVAEEYNVPLIDAPPGDEDALRALLAQLATIRTS
jgi:hypothetical protein